MHETLMVDGVMKMEALEQISLSPKGGVELKPGGKHLMLFSPRGELSVGDRIPFTVIFDDGTTRVVEFEVRP